MSLLLHCNKICGVYFKNVFRTLATQTQTLPQETQEEVKTEILNTRVVKKLPPKNPFMKNVFLGDFDSDVLAFPGNSCNHFMSILKVIGVVCKESVFERHNFKILTNLLIYNTTEASSLIQ